MRRREASINDLAIDEDDRRIFGPRGADQVGDLERDSEIPLQ
jgi:nuclear transport factor 2 (NTF2) superfamily protein